MKQTLVILALVCASASAAEKKAADPPEWGTRISPAIGQTYQDIVTNFNKGKPLTCNSTKTARGESLQCWYPDRFHSAPTMYFENWKLTAVQNH